MPRRTTRRSSQSQPLDKKQQLIFLGVAGVFSCLSFVVLVIAVPLYISGTSPQNTEPSDSQGPAIACVDCTQLILQPKDPLLDKMTKTEVNGVEKCCAFKDDQMSALLELSMRRQVQNTAQLPEFNATDFKFSRISAHKRLYPPNVTHSREPEFGTLIKCHFLKEEDHSREHVRGVTVRDDGLHIKETGMYFIYSSIEFMPDSNKRCSQFKYQTWKHRVKRAPKSEHSETTEVLLQTVHTCCDKCIKDDETSFTSGVFLLNDGDVIHIEVDANNLVRFSNTTSFAGLLMLGGGKYDKVMT